MSLDESTAYRQTQTDAETLLGPARSQKTTCCYTQRLVAMAEGGSNRQPGSNPQGLEQLTGINQEHWGSRHRARSAIGKSTT